MADQEAPNESSPRVDPILEEHVKMAEEREGGGLDVIVFVGGAVIAGTMVGHVEYYLALADCVTDKQSKTAEHFRKLADATRKEIVGGAVPAPEYVHLAKAQVLAGRTMAIDGSVVRVRVDRVDGWVWGRPSAS
jgi:hypothetical protein